MLHINKKNLLISYIIIVVYFLMLAKSIEQILSIVLIALIIGILNFFIVKEEKMQIHQKFFLVALVFGILFIFFVPILHGIDEGAHFFKVYSFFYDSKSHYNNDKKLVDEVPEVIIKADDIVNINEMSSILELTTDDTNTVETQEYIGAKLYSPISYITYLLPMFLFKKILNLNIFWIIILGRVFGFLAWLVITTYTIKIMPRKKEFMAFLCLLPIVLSVVTTFSGDVVNNMAIFLFIAIWYKLYIEKNKIKKREILLITVLGVIATCCKMVYALMFLLIFLLPEENFKNKKNKIIVTTGIMIVLILTFLVNINFVGSDLLKAYPAISKQKEFIKNNFFQYIGIFIRTIISYFFVYIYQFTTGKSTMCSNAIEVDNVISLACLIILLLALFREENKIKINKKEKVFIIGIAIIMISIIFLSLYLQWTATKYKIAYKYIEGVQGRYFIPIAALLIFINKKIKFDIDKDLLWTGVILINFIIVLKIMIMFFI